MYCTMNKARYNPSEKVFCQLADIPAGSAQITASLTHLHKVIMYINISIDSDQADLAIVLPNNDYTGYLLCLEARDTDGKSLAVSFTGVDCSSDWTHFPRYGYVWDFTASANPEEKLGILNRCHINALQFYDWQYRHHQPLAPDLSGWRDWSGRMIDGSTLRAYLDHAHKHGISCMAYNMIYAANMTYKGDGSGVDSSWRLVREAGGDFTCNMDASMGDTGILQYFNPLNPDWQKYIFEKENEIFAQLPFDGWHGDTIGENGPMTRDDGSPLGYDGNGKPIHRVKDCYRMFLDAAKNAIGDKYLAFNPVGAQGIEQVYQSKVDILYAEFWPWDRNTEGEPYETYSSLQREIIRAWELGRHKSLVVAAYVNYRNPSPLFNAPAVRLLDSVVFSSGGARLELGNGGHMLSDEYFPSDHKKRMDPELQAAVQRMYDFITAYENILRDGHKPVCRKVLADEYEVSENGLADTIWCFSKADTGHEVIHFINLVGTDNEWRDTQQTKKAPALLHDLHIRLYTDFAVQSVSLASPDDPDISLRELDYATETNLEGRCILFDIPSLAYWDMILLR